MSKKYFTEATEQAIHDYLISTGLTRQRIYSTILHPAFVTMTESIINRYFFGVQDHEEFDEIKYSAMGHLAKRLERFDPNRAKAFSYCQTIIKNFCNDYFRLRKQRNERYIPTDYDSLIEQHDRPVEDEAGSTIDHIFKFIDFLTTITGHTGGTQISLPLIRELKTIKEKCVVVGSEGYETRKITVFYKKIFKDKSQGWRETNLLKAEFKMWMKGRHNLN